MTQQGRRVHTLPHGRGGAVQVGAVRESEHEREDRRGLVAVAQAQAPRERKHGDVGREGRRGVVRQREALNNGGGEPQVTGALAKRDVAVGVQLPGANREEVVEHAVAGEDPAAARTAVVNQRGEPAAAVDLHLPQQQRLRKRRDRSGRRALQPPKLARHAGHRLCEPRDVWRRRRAGPGRPTGCRHPRYRPTRYQRGCGQQLCRRRVDHDGAITADRDKRPASRRHRRWQQVPVADGRCQRGSNVLLYERTENPRLFVVVAIVEQRVDGGRQHRQALRRGCRDLQAADPR